MMQKKHQGSCHCGKMKFEVDADLSKGTYRCNCSYCRKARNWGFIVKPDAFKWTTSEAGLGIYQITPGSKNYYYFCKHCGIRLSTKGYIEEIGGDYLSFSIATLDNVAAAELEVLPVQPMDGANNNWYAAPEHWRHL